MVNTTGRCRLHSSEVERRTVKVEQQGVSPIGQTKDWRQRNERLKLSIVVVGLVAAAAAVALRRR